MNSKGPTSRGLTGTVMALAVACALVGATSPATAATVISAKCADDSGAPGGVHRGGDWPLYGHDLSNTRSQPKEDKISPANVGSLAPAWTFSSQSAGGSGDFTGTPVVADGCVFVGTNAGWIFAINADSGKIVWRARLPKTGATTGNVNSSLAVPGDGRVYALVTNPTQGPCVGPDCEGPYAIAFDQDTGKTTWRTAPIDSQVGADVYSSPVAFYPKAPIAGQAQLPRSCRSRRAFRIRLKAPRGQRLVRAVVYVNGRRVQTVRGRRLRAPVNLRGLPRGRFTVKIVARTNRGRLVREKRTYRTCAARRASARAAARDGARHGVLILGVAGSAAEIGSSEQIRNANQGAVVLLDTVTGDLLKKVWTIRPPDKRCPSSVCPPEVGNEIASGAPVWSTAAVDPAAGVAYVGTGQPNNPGDASRPQTIAPTVDAVLKIGVDPNDKEHFGKILAHGSGDTEQFVRELGALPCFDAPGNQPIFVGGGGCTDFDLDFGASPNLFTDSKGRTLVGDGQKSGRYHAYDTGTMKPVWSTQVGTFSAEGGIVGSAAYDGKRIYGPNTAPALVWGLGRDAGSLAWNVATNGVENYGNSPAVANGVVYTSNFSGTLSALDAETGVLLHEFPLADRTATSGPTSTWGGVSIARNTVYVATGTTSFADGYIIAYRLGANGSPPPDKLEAPPADNSGDTTGGGRPGTQGPSAGQGAAVVVGPQGPTAGYLTKALITPAGNGLTFLNLDTVQHDVTAKQAGPDGQPLFRSKRIATGTNAPIDGIEKLKSGTYNFFCSIHPGMTGTIQVVGG